MLLFCLLGEDATGDATKIISTGRHCIFHTGPTFIFVVLLRWLVDDGAVLQAPKVEHPHATIRATADKYIDTPRTEAYIKDLLVVSDQLRLGR